MRMTSLVRGILARTQSRILASIDLSSIAEPTPGELSRTLETWTGVAARQDARNRLSLDFDMLRIEALKDLQVAPSTLGKVSYVGPKGPYGYIYRYPNGDSTVFRYKTEEARDRELAKYSYRASSVTLDASGKLPSGPPAIGPALDQIASTVASVNAKAVTELVGVNVRASSGLGATIDAFRERNLSLIKSLVGNQIDDIQTLLESSELTGLRVEDLRAQIMDRFGVGESKADLLARDQTLKLNANITQARQRGAGVEKYIWTTSGDERVRDEHAELEGEVFSWDNPPSVGHPGEDIQCRCTAFPIIEEFDGPGAGDDE